ncbi:unnamed protein product [Darwinula stevensoni]|uniref:DRBM domain-containing protein n=1 Tax=Darwinula stevensoni TaxID=69355 RepID=A0A7R8X4F4_9CRUS|nr:unnamed protein product [Darwinula stevensoni]CAG0878969.1 unnamed protein product [Darwinula stevensoni]
MPETIAAVAMAIQHNLSKSDLELGRLLESDGVGNLIGNLQEFCMGHQLPLPQYHTLAECGQPHSRQYTVACVIGPHNKIGCGASKKIAKHQAAHAMLTFLKETRVDLEKLKTATVKENKESVADSMSFQITTTNPDSTISHLIDKFQALKMSKIPKLTPETSNHVTSFLRNISMPLALDKTKKHTSLLNDLAVKNGFKSKYIHLEELTCDNEYQCILEIGAIPLVAAIGFGMNAAEAEEQAAKATINYLHYINTK